MNGLDLFYLAAGALSAPFWMRKQRGGWKERFGHVADMLEARAQTGKPRILLHAVSVGEVNALRTLVPLLREHAEVIVSVTTDTGLVRARSLFGESCAVVRYPLDFSGSVRRFLDAVEPDVVGLVELELWPNFLRACERRSIRVGVINGRLSARSFRGYHRFRRFVSPMFRRLALAGVQDEAYRERFVAMGVAVERCTITGSMKWDTVDVSGSSVGPTESARTLGAVLGIDPGRPLIVAGSTGPGEEALLHAACPAGVQLACAPRKPERFDDAAAALPGCVRRSRVGRLCEPTCSEGIDISEVGSESRPTRFLLDTIGELGMLYQLADLVVIGRSFFDLYGSDPIEPAALGKGVVIGAAHSDFDQPVRALRESDGIVVCEQENLRNTLHSLMDDKARRRTMGDNARACVREHQGASVRHAEMLMGLVRKEEQDG